MALSQESDFQLDSLPFVDQMESQPLLQSYLIIQDKISYLIPMPRPYPHLSLNPLSGNSLYS